MSSKMRTSLHALTHVVVCGFTFVAVGCKDVGKPLQEHGASAKSDAVAALEISKEFAEKVAVEEIVGRKQVDPASLTSEAIKCEEGWRVLVDPVSSGPGRFWYVTVNNEGKVARIAGGE